MRPQRPALGLATSLFERHSPGVGLRPPYLSWMGFQVMSRATMSDLRARVSVATALTREMVAACSSLSCV